MGVLKTNYLGFYLIVAEGEAVVANLAFFFNFVVVPPNRFRMCLYKQ